MQAYNVKLIIQLIENYHYQKKMDKDFCGDFTNARKRP